MPKEAGGMTKAEIQQSEATKSIESRVARLERAVVALAFAFEGVNKDVLLEIRRDVNRKDSLRDFIAELCSVKEEINEVCKLRPTGTGD